MIYVYDAVPGGLRPVSNPLAAGQDNVTTPDPDRLARADWIDLYRPTPEQEAAVAALGVQVPSLADMEEIEISSRLYREGNATFMTAVLPGQLPDGQPTSGPVTFIVTPERLITVRYHAPRPFEVFPARAEKTSSGCGSVDRIFLGLIEEVIARLADLLEQAGRVLDRVTYRIFDSKADNGPDVLETALDTVGQQAELMARVRLGLLSIERVLSFYATFMDKRGDAAKLRPVLKGHMRDIQALEVHHDFLSSRVGLAVDATLGMINLQQNETVRILSVVAALFLPPTLIASMYGMNFDHMPELHWDYGYPYALCLMVGSAVVTYLFLRWKKWL